MSTTMTPPAIRFAIESKIGEETGALVWIVRDTLTTRIRLVTSDIEEASQLSGALNDDAHLLVDAILNKCEYIEGVQYGEAI